MPETKKALPLITASNKPFWDAARRHELLLYKCPDCGMFYTQIVDCSCGSSLGDWVESSGRGNVFTFCIYRQAFHPAWQNDIPYNVAYVKLAEGPLLMTNIVDCPNEDIYIGMPGEVVFEDINEEISLPKFRPSG